MSEFPWNQPRPHPDPVAEAELQQLDAAINERIRPSSTAAAPVPEQAKAAPCGCDAVQWNPYNRVVQCHRCGRVVDIPRIQELEEVARLARRFLSSCLSRDGITLRAALKALEEESP